MAIEAACACGRTYSMDESYAGQSVECPACRALFAVPAVEGGSTASVFDRDFYVLSRRFLALAADRYGVLDEGGRALLYVKEPEHSLRNALTAAAAFLAALLIFSSLAVTAAVVTSGALALAALILAAPGAVLGGLCILVICCRRPRWVFFGDERRSEPVMDVLRRQKFALFGARFAVRSAAGEPLASLRKHYTWRTRWSCSRPDGSLWFVIHRGSSRPRLMRRFDTAGAGTTPDLVFADAGSDQVLGGLAFVGPGSGRCVLDMRADPDRSIDRRVAIAATVMLSIAGR